MCQSWYFPLSLIFGLLLRGWRTLKAFTTPGWPTLSVLERVGPSSPGAQVPLFGTWVFGWIFLLTIPNGCTFAPGRTFHLLNGSEGPDSSRDTRSTYQTEQHERRHVEVYGNIADQFLRSSRMRHGFAWAKCRPDRGTVPAQGIFYLLTKHGKLLTVASSQF